MGLWGDCRGYAETAARTGAAQKRMGGVIKTVNSGQGAVNRGALPREYDQAVAGRRPMLNPALATYGQALPAQPTKCCMQDCENGAMVGAWCHGCWQTYRALEAHWEREQRWDGTHERRRLNIARNRRARRWRFVNSFIFMLILELGISWSLNAIDLWQNWLLCVGWAMLIASMAALFGGAKAGVDQGRQAK